MLITRAKLYRLHKSLTIWFNSVAGAFVLGLPILQESLPELAPYIPQEVFRYVMLVVVVGNILLRFKTSIGLENK